MADGSWKTLAGIFGLVFAIGVLASIGVLPKSCGKMLPGSIGRSFEEYCDECDGEGMVKRSCPSCFGRGYYEGVQCSNCTGSGKLEQTCKFCAGSGKKPTKVDTAAKQKDIEPVAAPDPGAKSGF